MRSAGIQGAAVGAAGGAAIGAVLQQGVDGSFVKEVSQSIEPGKSALFLEIGAGHPSAIDALKLGAADYLQKPLDPARLVSLVRELLSSDNVREADGDDDELEPGTLD